MSWKSIVTVALFCIVASPALADPSVVIVKGGNQANGNLNDAGDWVWKVQIVTSNPIPTGSSSYAAELGFKEVGQNETLLSASQTGSATTGFSSTATFDKLNPGSKIFTWEAPGTGTNGNPEGIQTNCAAGCTVTGSLNEIFSALGSINISSPGNLNYLEIVVKGPSVGTDNTVGTGDDRRTTQINLVGAYPVDLTGGNGVGRVAEACTTGTGCVGGVKNFDIAQFNVSRTAKGGDANLDNSVDPADFGTWLANVGNTNTPWYLGDFNDDGSIDPADFGIWLNNVGAGAGSSLGGGSSVPEPASMALIALGSLLVVGLRLRQR